MVHKRQLNVITLSGSNLYTCPPAEWLQCACMWLTVTPDLKTQVVSLVHKQLNLFAAFQNLLNVVNHDIFHLIHLSSTHLTGAQRSISSLYGLHLT